MKAVIAMLAAALLLFMAGCGEETAPPPPSSPDPVSSQAVRQQALTPTLTLGSQVVHASVAIREEQLTQEAKEAAANTLGEARGSATVPEDGVLPGFRFSQQPDQVEASLIPAGEAGEPLFQGTLEELEGYVPPQEGAYTLDIWAGWTGEPEGFNGLAGYRVELTYQLPEDRPIQLAVDNSELRQGYCAVLRASNLPEGTTQVTAVTDMGFTPTFYPYQGEMIALMPAKYSSSVGEYHITITAGEESQDFVLAVTDGGFDVNVDLQEGLPPVLADPAGVLRVFTNLIRNALDHGQGRMEVSLFLEEGQVVSLFRNGAEGLSEEDLPHVFDRFFTADKIRTGRNTGLGLAIVKALAEQMGCTLQAELEDGRFGVRIAWKSCAPRL